VGTFNKLIMTKGSINVSVENIFPLIKKFLYSDHEIFLRELISNATDATLKLKHLANVGDVKVEYGNPKIEVKIDKDNKKLHIIDQGLGMTADEVEKYINQIAFSGAEEFLDKYKDSAKDSGTGQQYACGIEYRLFELPRQLSDLGCRCLRHQIRGCDRIARYGAWTVEP
jgi:molecular chaperone HtpG